MSLWMKTLLKSYWTRVELVTKLKMIEMSIVLKTIEVSVLLKIKVTIVDMRYFNSIKQRKNVKNEKTIKKC